jgi:putative transcriptional regulator
MESALDIRRVTLSSSLSIRMRNDVRRLRTERRLSQEQLGRALAVSRQTINSIEQERYTPSLPLAIALARYFGRPVEEIFQAGDA